MPHIDYQTLYAIQIRIITVIIAAMKYYIWTSGCQMNVADSRRVASALQRLGYDPTRQAENADVIVLNTCVVRQSAENRALGRLSSLRPLKKQRPDLVINLMGCLVGIKDNPKIRKAFPYVDVFSAPSDLKPLIQYLMHSRRPPISDIETKADRIIAESDLTMPKNGKNRSVSAYVSVIHGCSFACTYCIIPYRRGVERSRPICEIEAEVRALAGQGIHEVTLLGQIVDRYGNDIHDGPNLSDLLRAIHPIDGIKRIRFLTSHPHWMTNELIETVAELPKVCEYVEVPIQAGDDDVLKRMKRGYTVDEYVRLICDLREYIPGVSIATDIIVGFPGETEKQFQRTYNLLADLRLDVVHLARYSPRPGTLAYRRMDDDIHESEKMRRFRAIEALQTQISKDIHASYIGRKVEVLVKSKRHDRWKGRTRTNKLVFFETPEDRLGELVSVKINWAGAWSLRGTPFLGMPGEP